MSLSLPCVFYYRSQDFTLDVCDSCDALWPFTSGSIDVCHLAVSAGESAGINEKA